MYPYHFVVAITCLGVLCSGQGISCQNPQVVVEYQPFEFLCSGTTDISTQIRTSTECATTVPSTVTETVGGPTAGTSTIVGSGTSPPTVVITTVPGTVTETVGGPTAGTSTVVGSGTSPPTVVITTVPGTVTETVGGPTAGTSTVAGSGTSPPTVVITTVPGTVTETVGGPTAGTSTIAGSGTSPLTVVITTVPATVTETVGGPIAGTSTIAGSGTTPATVVITIVPLTVTDTVGGLTPGTSTIPGSGTSPATVVITTVSLTVTDTVAGPTAGTSTIPGSGTSPPIVVITTVPVAVTETVTGSTAGTTTLSASGTTPPEVVVTVTQTPLPPPPQKCNNAGVGYAVQQHNFYNGDANFSSVNVDYFKTKAPEQQGVTNVVGFDFLNNDNTNNFGSIYGGPLINITYIAVNHHAYLYALLSGTYQFEIIQSDDLTLIWLGDVAYTSYERDNTLLQQVYLGNYNGIFSGTPATASITLTQGDYYPLRILAINGQQSFAFTLQITAPDGETILSNATSSGSPFLVQYSCNATEAPPFPPFGDEV